MSRIFSFFILSILVLSLCLDSQAQTAADSNKQEEKNETVSKPSSKRQVRKIKTIALTVGPEVRNYKYSEPGFVTHQGLLYGGNIDFYKSLRRPQYDMNGFYVFGTAYSVGGQLLFGTIDYIGSACSTVPPYECIPYEDKTSDLIYRIYAKYHMEPSTRFSIQFGLGYRVLTDKGHSDIFYLRTGTWLYAPIEVEYKESILKDLKLILSSEFDWVLAGGIRSNLSELDQSYNDVYMAQTGSGIILKAGIEYKSVVANLIYETWNLNESKPAESGGLSFVEPKNSSQSIGLQLSYDFF